MASNNVSLVRSEEMYAAFVAARAAGKVAHWGLSTHENAKAVLEAASDTGWYSLVQIAVTPAGWYDWKTKNVMSDSPPMTALRPTFDRARAVRIEVAELRAAADFARRGLDAAVQSLRALRRRQIEVPETDRFRRNVTDAVRGICRGTGEQHQRRECKNQASSSLHLCLHAQG